MIDIVPHLERWGIPYRTHGQHHHAASSDWIQVDCPLCSPGSGRFRLGLNIRRCYANCWMCGGMGFFRALSLVTGRDERSLIREVGYVRGRDLPIEKTAEPIGRLRIPAGVGPLLGPHRKYLEKRGFDPDEVVRLWGVKGIGIAPRLSWSLWIPVHWEGKLVSWTTRRIGEGNPRYISARPSEQLLSPKRILYGGDYCRMSAIVVEGPTDVWAIGPGAVATMGTSVTEDQLGLIARYPLRVIAFDNEPDAQRRAMRLARRLLVYPGETIVVCPESGKDWAEAEREEIAMLRGLLE